jgi:hypothetical protein
MRGKNNFISSGFIIFNSLSDTGIKIVGITNRKIKMRAIDNKSKADFNRFFIIYLL